MNSKDGLDWKMIFNSIPHPTAVFDFNHNILAVNRKLEIIYGKSFEEFKHLKCWQIFHSEDITSAVAGCPFEKMLNNPGSRIFESEIGALGSTYLVSCTPLFKEDGELDKVIHIATNIADRKSAEKRFEAISESANDAIITVDGNGSIIHWNSGATKIFGYQIEEVLLRSITMILPERFVDPHSQAMNRVRLNGERHVIGKTVEVFALHKSGNEIPVELSISEWEVGGEKYFTGIIRDISDRKKTEADLITSKKLLEEMSSTAQIGGWGLRVNPLSLSWSSETYKIHEVETGLTLNLETAVEFYAPESLSIIQKAVERCIQFFEPFDLELQLITAKGNKIWVHSIGRANLENGIVVSLSGTIQNITPRKRLEFEKQLFSRVLEQSLNEIYLFRMDNLKFVNVNKGGRDNIGYSIEELYSMTPLNIKPELSTYEFKELLKPLINKTEQIVSFTTYHRRKDGSLYPVEAHVSAHHADNLFIAFINDISERIIAEQQQAQIIEELQESKSFIEENLHQNNLLLEILSETKDKLEESNLEKDKFFSIIAHDLRSPFNGFLNLTEMMATGSVDFTIEEYSELSKSLNDSAVTLYKLINNLLEWALLQKGATEVNPISFNVYFVVNQSANINRERALQKGIKIINSIPDDYFVFADEKMIATVFRNLMSNAVKFTGKDGTVTIRSQAVDDNLQISVADTGIGMSETDKDRLFKIGEKVSAKGTDNEPSTGLGLILCKEFIEKNNGRIWVESEKGKGSTFYFTLPMNRPMTVQTKCHA